MASTMIHYIVANRIIEEYKIGNINRFLMGNVFAPDASSHEDSSYDIAHFLRCTKAKKGIDWHLFEKKYKDMMLQDDFYLGYWCHLIQDAIWFHDIVDKYIRIFSGDEKKAYYQKGYRDYMRLNYLLRQRYRVEIPQFDLESPNVEEISKPLLDGLQTDFLSHFNTPKCAKHELEVYKEEIIIEFIELSVRLCISEMNGIKNLTERINPECFFVKK